MLRFGFIRSGRAFVLPLREGWRVIARENLQLQRQECNRWVDVRERESLPLDRAAGIRESHFPVVRPRPGAMFGVLQ